MTPTGAGFATSKREVPFSFVEQLPVMAHAVNPEGCIVAASDHWLHVLGYERGEVIKQPIVNLMSGLSAEEWGDFFSRVLNEGSEHGQFQLRRKDGTPVEVLDSSSLIREGNGELICIVGILQDLTERRATEAALIESTQFSQQVVTQAGEGIIVYDKDYRLVVWNPIMEALTGLPASRVLGHRATDLFPYLIELRIDRLWRRALQGERVRTGDIQFHIPPSGRQGWIKSTFGPHINASGEIIGVIEIVRDVTARRNSQEALQYRVDLEQLISEISTSFINFTRLEIDQGVDDALELIGRFAGAERAFLLRVQSDGRMIFSHFWCAEGMQWPEIRRAPVHLTECPWLANALEHPEMALQIDQFAELCKESQGDCLNWCVDLAKNSVVLQPLQFRGKPTGFVAFESAQKPKTWTQDHLALLKIVGEMFVSALERKRSEESLRTSEERLLQSQKMEAVGRLAGGVAHDFNNLLTAIHGYSDLLQRNLGDIQLREHAVQIVKAAERASSLTQQLLAFSRRQVLRPQVIRVNEVIADMSDMLQRLIGKHIELKLSLCVESTTVLADPAQLGQVVMNLVVNARDAMPTGGILELGTEVQHINEALAGEMHLELACCYVLIKVKDSGLGMTDETLEHIFEPFFTTKERGKGTGLGLATVYGIVEQSGGSLSVDSKLGKGTSFCVYLPYADEKPISAQRKTSGETVRSGTETILLAEDEEQVRQLIRHILEDSGYAVIEAGDGREALESFRRDTGGIDLVLTDIVMPRMGGLELAEEVTKHKPAAKILFMSGYTPDSLPKLGSLSQENFMHKPFSPAQLMERVERALAAV